MVQTPKQGHIHIPVTDEDRGEITCIDCGHVLETEIIVPDRRTPEEKETWLDTKRTGPNIIPMLHDGGLSTIISKDNITVKEIHYTINQISIDYDCGIKDLIVEVKGH